MNYYAHVPCGEKLPKSLPPIEIIDKSTVILSTCSTSKLANVPGSNAVMSEEIMIFFKLDVSKMTMPYIRV